MYSCIAMHTSRGGVLVVQLYVYVYVYVSSIGCRSDVFLFEARQLPYHGAPVLPVPPEYSRVE